VIAYDMPPLASGDVVLVNHLASPRPGNVVLYDVPDYTYTAQRGHETRYTHMTGERIDRILAGPGDRVVWDKGRLMVNGAASDLLPLNPRITPSNRLALTVPEDAFFILPSTTPYVRADDDDEAWRAMGIVPWWRVAGRVYARTNPLRRFSLFGASR
jgi:hypothetical protein